jgi:ElaB/YqjD/DUF883 family membrane-anchored ribosome-binding protein
LRSPNHFKERKTPKQISRGFTLRTIGVGVIGLAVPLWAGTSIINERDRAEVIDVENATQELSTTQDRQEEAAKNLTRTKQSIGEACLSSLSDYMPGGSLVNTEENNIISDMQGETGLPCGDTPKEIRQKIRILKTSYDNESAATQQTIESEAKIEPLREESILTNADDYFGVGVASAIGLAFGLGVGAVWGTIYSEDAKRKS